MKAFEKLTFERVTVRAVAIPLRRPVVAKVGTYPEWPFILIDVHTKEGVIGRSYLEPYLKNASRTWPIYSKAAPWHRLTCTAM